MGIPGSGHPGYLRDGRLGATRCRCGASGFMRRELIGSARPRSNGFSAHMLSASLPAPMKGYLWATYRIYGPGSSPGHDVSSVDHRSSRIHGRRFRGKPPGSGGAMAPVLFRQDSWRATEGLLGRSGWKVLAKSVGGHGTPSRRPCAQPAPQQCPPPQAPHMPHPTAPSLPVVPSWNSFCRSRRSQAEARLLLRRPGRNPVGRTLGFVADGPPSGHGRSEAVFSAMRRRPRRVRSSTDLQELPGDGQLVDAVRL